MDTIDTFFENLKKSRNKRKNINNHKDQSSSNKLSSLNNNETEIINLNKIQPNHVVLNKSNGINEFCKCINQSSTNPEFLLKAMKYREINKITVTGPFNILPEINNPFFDPTPIQSQVIPILMNGNNCIGIAPTGTGKTFSFAFPILKKRALVLSPTRELSMQTYKMIHTLLNRVKINNIYDYHEDDDTNIENEHIKAEYIKNGYGRVALMIGGTELKYDFPKVKSQIIVGTPGRVIDVAQIKKLDVEILIIDEVDMMVDSGFLPQIFKILKIIGNVQVGLFSATYSNNIEKIKNAVLKMKTDALKFILDSKEDLNESESLKLNHENTIGNKICKKCRKYKPIDFFTVKIIDKSNITEIFIKNENKTESLIQILKNLNRKFLIFVNSCSKADELACILIKFSALSLHSEREQCDREEILNLFRSNTTNVLVCTSLMSRGIDLDVDVVINYEYRELDYLQRIGRTGRNGRHGYAISFLDNEKVVSIDECLKIIKNNERDSKKRTNECSNINENGRGLYRLDKKKRGEKQSIKRQHKTKKYFSDQIRYKLIKEVARLTNETIFNEDSSIENDSENKKI
ncbi:Pre-mRNA-processing ATP-dependent RNA helicase PRP5 [Dictyocoela muelleri]|nr:Pre-mRNA-processing ATP-dependent RNA helicase PRP5 [Dictyocoela muelleri]